MEEEIRKAAIERYLKGEKPKSIYENLNRPKAWFCKWLKRYQSGSPDWYQSRSRAPLSHPKRICEKDRQRIVETRKRLEAIHIAQTGVGAIKWELAKSGSTLPSDRTINRVLKEEGLVKKNIIRTQGR